MGPFITVPIDGGAMGMAGAPGRPHARARRHGHARARRPRGGHGGYGGTRPAPGWAASTTTWTRRKTSAPCWTTGTCRVLGERGCWQTSAQGC